MTTPARVTIVLDPDDEAEAARVIAVLLDLKMDYQQGDSDGRRWIQISGVIAAKELPSLVQLLKNSN